uniref:anthranilate synthase n=1 Tax=Tetradesmus obliquus TaxID=3088 RepID=A0A383W6D7_TETOB|eukprot:jgi/Sobl393_1/6428/SZX78080.1
MAALHQHRCLQHKAAARRQRPCIRQLACPSISRVSRSSRRAVAAAAAGKGPIVVIDNYDSFTYNLVQYLGDLGADFLVLKNDEKTVDEIRALNPAGILVSPGPGKPTDSGISLQAVRELGPDFPLFGVCMGHQCIGEAFGGDVVRAPCGVMHGKTSPVFHTDKGVLQGLENPFQAARYHSLVISQTACPEDLEITAWTEDGTIMAVQHKKYPHIQGVQFHPESIITQNGKRIVANFLRIVGQDPQEGATAAAAAAAEPSLSVSA